MQDSAEPSDFLLHCPQLREVTHNVPISEHLSIEELFWSAPFTGSTVSLKAFLPWQTVWHQIWPHSYHIS